MSFHNYDILIILINGCCILITKYSLSLLFSHALPFPEKQECLLRTSHEINSTVRYAHCDPVRHVNRLRFRVSGRVPFKINLGPRML